MSSRALDIKLPQSARMWQEKQDTGWTSVETKGCRALKIQKQHCQWVLAHVDTSPWAKRGVCNAARYAEKCACNAVYVHTSPSLTRESLFLVSETYVQKMSQLGSILTVDVVATISLGPQLFPICIMNTTHLLRHLWCSCQRPSCHSSLLQQLCDHVDAEAVDVSEKAFFQCWLSHSSFSWITCSSSSFRRVLWSFGINVCFSSWFFSNTI